MYELKFFYTQLVHQHFSLTPEDFLASCNQCVVKANPVPVPNSTCTINLQTYKHFLKILKGCILKKIVVLPPVVLYMCCVWAIFGNFTFLKQIDMLWWNLVFFLVYMRILLCQISLKCEVRSNGEVKCVLKLCCVDVDELHKWFQCNGSKFVKKVGCLLYHML